MSKCPRSTWNCSTISAAFGPQQPLTAATTSGAGVALQFASDLSRNFLMVALFQSANLDGRTIVKFEYDDPVRIGAMRRIVKPLIVDIEGPTSESAKSLHFELRAPDGASAVQLKTLDAKRVVLASDGSKGPAVHIHTDPEHHGGGIRFEASLTPERRGIVNWSLTTSISVAALFILGAVKWPQIVNALDPGRGEPASIATVLLAVPAFLLVFLAKTPEHYLVFKLLRPARINVLLATGVLMLSAAVLLITSPVGWPGAFLPSVSAALQFVNAVVAGLIWRSSDAVLSSSQHPRRQALEHEQRTSGS